MCSANVLVSFQVISSYVSDAALHSSGVDSNLIKKLMLSKCRSPEMTGAALSLLNLVSAIGGSEASWP